MQAIARRRSDIKHGLCSKHLQHGFDKFSVEGVIIALMRAHLFVFRRCF
jgi:hypothetical protein